MKINISIDLDFFHRELQSWDWGHAEGDIFANSVWLARYCALDLYKETDILTYADILPTKFLSKLKRLGYIFNHNTKIGYDVSHRYAYNFFREYPAEVLYNFDAHHDFGYACDYPYADIDNTQISCGNWVRCLHTKHLIDRYYHIAPKHAHKCQFIEFNGATTVNWETFLRFGIHCPSEINAIFFAQSPEWVAPHFDSYFKKIIAQCKIMCNYKQDCYTIQGLVVRKPPTRKEALNLHQSNKDMIKRIQNNMMSTK